MVSCIKLCLEEIPEVAHLIGLCLLSLDETLLFLNVV